MKMLILFFILIATFIGSFGALFLKKGAEKLNFKQAVFSLVWEFLTNKELLIGIAFYVFSAGFYLYALSLGEVSFVYPLVSLSYLWVVLLSWKYLQEPLTKEKMIGVVFIIIGVILLTL